jgi:photosystem II stability/assembly factor-like uncharacterized protein
MTIVPWLTTTHWLPAGPSPISAPGVGLGLAAGRIEAAAPHPAWPDVMLVGANGGGVWKTGVWNNDPPVWIVTTDDQPSINFSGYHPLAVHPESHDLVFGCVSGPGAGVLKSTNGGLSWTLLGNNLFEGATLGSLALHPTNTSVLYVSVWNPGYSAAGGVYKSTDGGVNWTNLTAFHAGGVSDVVIARWDKHVLFAGLVSLSNLAGTSTAGVYRSTDSGATWHIMAGTGLASNFFLGTAVRLESASTKGTAYVSFFYNELEGDTVVVRAKTKDKGQTWKELAPTPGTPELRSWHLVLGVDPKNEKHVIVNDAYALYESKDSGQTWKRADGTIGDDWVNVAFASDGSVAATADRNVYRYDPTSATWASKEGNLQVTLFYDITLDPGDPDVVYGVAQDHPLAMRFDGTIEWGYTPKGGGETGKVLVDPGNTSRIYVSNPLAPSQLVRRSTDGGQTWKTILTTNAFSSDDYDLAYATQRSFAMDPQKPARLLLGTTMVFETTNAGAASPTWAPISGVLSPSSSVADQYVTALAIAPSDGQTVYAATADGHLWATTNGGGTWKQRDNGFYGTGAGVVIDIRIDPADPKRVFIALTGVGGVWWTPKLGTTPWAKIGAGIPSHLSVGTVFADWQYSPPALYAGTSRGVYHSVNLGGSWSPFGLDMPNTVVSDLQGYAPLNILAAATFGRGVWEILAPPSKIAGKIFHDLDGDGIEADGDPPLRHVRVVLEVEGVGPLRTVATDARGRYAFDGVPPGRYRVRATAPDGYVCTSRGRGGLTLSGSDVDGLDLGLRVDPVLARAAEPYRRLADLQALPGRAPGQPVGTEHEFDRDGQVEPRPRRRPARTGVGSRVKA